MPEKNTIDKAKQALRKGKSPSTAAGEFIREEMKELENGNRGVRSRKQAIAIGLAKARRAGVPLRPQPESRAEARARRSVERAYEVGQKKKAAAAPAVKRKRKRVASKSTLSRRVKAPTRRKRAASPPGR